ncbi:MAG: efflux RND transporter periplasmic adaptor subunit [Chitinophagaceae bacterium]
MLHPFVKLVSLILLPILISCSSKDDKQEPTKQKPAAGAGTVFDAVIVQSSPIARTVETPGSILPNEMAELHPEISGRVTGLSFTEGGFVRKGTLLVKLFDADLQAQLKKLVVQLKIAESAGMRQQELLAINGTSQQDFDNASLQVSNIKADMELLRVNITKTEIRAPFDGRIGLRQISPGAYITPATVVTNIASVNQVKIQFPLPEQYVRDVMNGTTVSFTMGGGDAKYFATIMATENEIATDTRNLMVKALVKNPDALVKPGGYANVMVNIGNNRPAMMVPTQSVMPQTRGKKVIVVRRGMAVFQNVETGYRDSASVEILSGLMNGDTLLTSGLLIIKPDQKITKINIAKK